MSGDTARRAAVPPSAGRPAAGPAGGPAAHALGVWTVPGWSLRALFAAIALPFALVGVPLGTWTGIAAALIGVVTIATMRSNAFPRWVAYTGWVAILGAIASVIFVPIVLPLLWFLAVAIIGLTRPIGPAAPAATV